MKKNTISVVTKACVAMALACAFTMPAHADGFNRSSVLGGALGGGAGAVIGSSIGGRDGAILGGAIGAAAGVAIASQPPRYRAEPPRYRPAPQVYYQQAPVVYYQPVPRVYYAPAPREYVVYERDWRGPHHHERDHGFRHGRPYGYGY